MQEMRSLPAVFRFPMAVLRFGAGALVVCFTAVLAVLGWVAEVSSGTRDRTEQDEYYWTGDGDDGFDQFGAPLTPGEAGGSLVKRKHWL